MNNRTTRRRAQFERIEPQYGQLLHLVAFEWYGERLQLAVIQPWRVRRYLPLYIRSRDYPFPPLEMITGNLQIQVVSVEAMVSVCGRVLSTYRNGTPRQVIFETSLGSGIPDFRDGQ